MKNILKNCRTLSEVYLSNCTNITDSAFEAILLDPKIRNPPSTSNIRRLDISENSNITDVSVQHIVRGCPLLEYLNVTKCVNVSVKSILTLSSCKNMEGLCISGTSALAKKSHTTSNGDIISLEDAFLAFADSCSKLKSIYACSSPYLSNTAINYITGFCQNLQDVDISISANITDESLAFIGMRCPQLRRLIIKQCPRLSDKGMEALAKGAHQLEVLDISRNNRITDVSLFTLTQYGKGMMKELHLSYCTGISKAGLIPICKEFKSLRVLQLDHCFQLTYETIELLRLLRPNIISAKLNQ